MQNQTAFARNIAMATKYQLDATASTGNAREACLKLAVASLDAAMRARGTVEEYNIYAHLANAVSAMQRNEFGSEQL